MPPWSWTAGAKMRKIFRETDSVGYCNTMTFAGPSGLTVMT